jgi:hypothetical protein
LTFEKRWPLNVTTSLPLMVKFLMRPGYQLSALYQIELSLLNSPSLRGRAMQWRAQNAFTAAIPI